MGLRTGSIITILLAGQGTLLLVTQGEPVASFTLTSVPRRSRLPPPQRPLYSTTRSSEPQTAPLNKEEELLSDVDTRVLQSMLQEETLSLDTEEGIRQLLERGTTGQAKQSKAQPTPSPSDSPYASTVLQTFADTRLWRKLSAQADDWLGSLSLWVTNKVEQDLKVVAALGLFAWDRVQRDVARALPEQSTAGRYRRVGPLQLSNTSSFTEPYTRSAREDLRRPSDEIRSVTRSILDILAGQTTDASGRVLRTAAPSGTVSVQERQKRAYRQKTRTRQQQVDVTRIPQRAVDAAWELKRELQAETSRPGYKTEPLRTALKEGVEQTGKFLKAAKQRRQLEASRQAFARLQQAQEAVSLTQEALMDQLVQERADLLQRLKACISTPENTWLSDAVLTAAAKDPAFKMDGEGLQQLVSVMIEIRDGMEGNPGDIDASFDDRLQELSSLRHRIAGLKDRATTVVSAAVAETLFNEIIGWDEETDIDPNDSLEHRPVLLRLEELKENFEKLQSTRTQVEKEYTGLESSLMDLENAVAELQVDSEADLWLTEDDSDESNVTPSMRNEAVVPDFVDVVPEPVYTTRAADTATVTAPFYAATELLMEEDDTLQPQTPGMVAEIVTDEDFDAAFGNARVTTAVDADDAHESESNPLVDLTLRALDVVFFVLEKTLTVVIPNTFRLGETVSDRIQQMQKTNNGSAGWERVRNTVDAKGRY